MSGKIPSLPPAQFLVGLFWLVLAGVTLAGTVSLHAEEGVAVGPAFFPRLLALGLVVLTGCHWLQARRTGPSDGDAEPVAPRDRWRMAGLVLLALATAVLWEKLGALASLFVFCLVELKWLEGYGWVRATTVTAAAVTLVWLCFSLLLGVNLPLGVLIVLY